MDFSASEHESCEMTSIICSVFSASCYDKMEKLRKGKPLILLLLGVLELTSYALTILLYLSQVTVSVPRNTLSLLM